MPPANYLQLHELAERIHNAVEAQFQLPLWVVAEVASITESASGHCYLELTEFDEKSRTQLTSMRAIIWANKYSELRSFFEVTTHTTLRKGIQLMLRVRVEYSVRYGLALQVIDIDPQYTVGELALQRQRTLEQLERDGVLYMNRELPFPEFPHHVAVISAARAAGYQDFCHQLQGAVERYGIQLKLFPALVQGDKAVESIARALDLVFAEEEYWDIVVIIRGGGGQMDLSCFDAYELASLVAQFPLPIVTGIGHERDVSVVDLVANVSLKTPTAVAAYLENIFVEAENELFVKLRELIPLLLNYTTEQTEVLSTLANTLARNKENLLTTHKLRLLRQFEASSLRFRALVEQYSPRIAHFADRTTLVAQNLLRQYPVQVTHLFTEIRPMVQNRLQQLELQFLHRLLILQRLDPRFALKHGFAIVQAGDKGSLSALTVGEEIRLYTALQTVQATVSRVVPQTLFPNLNEECESQQEWLETLYEKKEF